jgi:putative transposase
VATACAHTPSPSLLILVRNVPSYFHPASESETVRGGRAGPTFHNAGGRGGRTIGTKRSILVEILGLPLAVRVDPAKPHDVRVGRELIAERLDELPGIQAIIADRGYRGLAKLAARKHVRLDIKTPPQGTTGFTPLWPLYKVEHAFARLGRWRRLSRCYEGTEASARAWLEVASVGYLLTRLRAEPT